MRGKTVLVTGATGFVGGHLCLRLAADGARVRALARSPEKAAALRGNDHIEVVQGDLNAPDSLRAAAEGCDIVFNLAVATGPRKLQQRVNVEGARHVAVAAAEAGARRVVHVSSISAYGYRLDGDTTENTPIVFKSNDPYAETKADSERAVRYVATEHGIEFSIVRPGMIYGPGALLWTRSLFRVARIRPTPFLGDGSGTAHPIFIDDLADLLVVVGNHPAAANQVFNGTPDPAPTWRTWMSHYQRLAGHDRWLAIPPGLIQPIANLIGAVVPAGMEAKEAPNIVRMFRRQFTHRMDKARDLLGWQASVDLETGVDRCALWLREQGLLR